MNIRLENKQDFYTVELLTRDAFWGEFEPGCVEHYLAHILRDAPCFIPELDFVAEQDGRVIANVMFSHGSIDSPDGQRHDAITFGPFSVASASIRAAFSICGSCVRRTCCRMRLISSKYCVFMPFPLQPAHGSAPGGSRTWTA